MPTLLIQIGLWALTLLVIVSAVFVVTLGNLFRAALSLGLVLVGVAGLFVLLEAEFLAFVQILVYVGAILTLVVFAIMLTPPLSLPSVRTSNRQASSAVASASPEASAVEKGAGLTAPLHGATLSHTASKQMPAAAAAIALFMLLATVTHSLARSLPLAPSAVSLQQLGHELITTLVLPFEVISLVFVAAMVGAIAVASTPSHGRKPQSQ